MCRIETKHHPLAAAARTAAAAIAALAVIACLATACSNDDARDPAAGLDPTTQPLIFSATVATPTTAVATPTTRANTAAGQWTDGDEVAVEMNGVVKKYIIKTDAGAGATASLRPADAANTHFWPDLDQPVTVRAWRYGDSRPSPDPNDEFYIDQYPWHRKPDAWIVWSSQDMTDNNGEFRYQQNDFLYAPEQSVSYDATAGIGLTFYHQTARVEVRIRKAGLVKDDTKGEMRVYLGRAPGDSYELLKEATFDASQINPGNGEFSGLTANEATERTFIISKPMSGATPEGYAHYCESLVIPQNMDGKYLICVLVDGKYCYYKPKPGEANLRGGYTYTYDITVSEHGTLDVTVAKPIAGWENQGEGGSGTVEPLIQIDLDNPPTINDNGMYLLTGESTKRTSINITGGNPTVIVRDLKLTEGCIHITGGTPYIKVEGTNNEISNYNYQPPIWLHGPDANVDITGKGINESRLKLSTATIYPYAVIGSEGRNDGINSQCGNIGISNLTLYANIEMLTASQYGGAAIGTSGGGGNRKCGHIFIADAHIIAGPANGAAAIGFGSASPNDDMTGITYEMGNITIMGATTIESTIKEGANGIYPAHIGSGSVMAENYNTGIIVINYNKSGPEFFGKFNGGTKSDDEIIVGFPNGKMWRILWNDPNGRYITEINWSMVR